MIYKENEEYFVDGLPVPRVSKELERFGYKKSITYINSAMRYAMNRGSIIHNLIYTNDKSKYTLEVEFALNAVKGDIVLKEHIIYCQELHYAGTLDAVIRHENKLVVIDYKTGKRASWHPYQLAMYAIPLGIKKGYNVYVDQRKVIPYDLTPYIENIKKTYEVLNAIQFERTNELNETAGENVIHNDELQATKQE